LLCEAVTEQQPHNLTMHQYRLTTRIHASLRVVLGSNHCGC